MKATAILAVMIGCVGLQGCGPVGEQSPYGTRSCGLIACISSPYLRAKLDPSVIGQPVSVSISKAGIPDKSFQIQDTLYLSWERIQDSPDTGLLSCTETITVKNAIIQTYRFDGHC